LIYEDKQLECHIIEKNKFSLPAKGTPTLQ